MSNGVRMSWLLFGLLLAFLLPAPVGGQDYVIGPADVLTITIWGHPDLTGDYRVESDGRLSFPLIGQIAAGGHTPREVAASLTDLLGKAVEPHLAIHSNSDIWTQVTILEEAFLHTGKTLLQAVDDGAYRPPGHTHL